jgi:hypothetical protein
MVFVAQAVAQPWFRHAGGMAPFKLTLKPADRYLSLAADPYLSLAEREEIALLKT